ncbi:AI-2E family transporter [Clostridium akagii]|uniref:AI-2E family transporter n=1 Tax=Clostridium akagii TaxID=91623 RepID=UPI00047DE7E9|nr:AI-2E family transporter [Clostridium akagii]
MYKKSAKCILLLIFFIILDLIIKEYFNPFFSIIILLLLSAPIYKVLMKYNIFNNKVNAIITIITVNVIMFFTIVCSGSILIIKIKYFISDFCNNVTIGEIDKHLPIVQYLKIDDIALKVKAYIIESLNFRIMQKGAFITTDFIISYFVGNISTYFILVDYCDIVKYIKSYISDNKVTLIKKKAIEVKNIVVIEFLLVIITTAETICGFVILEVDSAVFWGVLCGILDILPYVGTLLIFLPLVIYQIYIKKYIIAMGLIFLYILLQFNRQIMETKYMSMNLQIHPLLFLISIYIGSKVFGMIGLIVGPIYLLIAKEIVTS